jgi:hypothetical protein
MAVKASRNRAAFSDEAEPAANATGGNGSHSEARTIRVRPIRAGSVSRMTS